MHLLFLELGLRDQFYAIGVNGEKEGRYFVLIASSCLLQDSDVSLQGLSER